MLTNLFLAPLIDVLVDIFNLAGLLAMFMCVLAKGLNILVKALYRGEIVV